MSGGLTVPVLGVVSGKLDFVDMSVESIPRLPGGSVLRVGVGLGSGETARIIGPWGDLPSIRLFNENGEKIAHDNKPGYILSGSARHITLDHYEAVQYQAPYAVFGTGKQPVCLAHLAIVWPDGSKYGWVGDWGRQCGTPWYYSNVYIPGTDVKADCMWLDHNRRIGGFQVHFPDFSGKHDQTLPEDAAGQKKMVDWYCKSGPPFRVTPENPKEVVYWKGPKAPFDRGAGSHDSIATANFTLTEQDQQDQQDDQTESESILEESGSPILVVTHEEQHSAEDLCNSETSAGPDLLNLYSKMFCRMSDKTLWPVCDTVNVTENCFKISRGILVTNDFGTAAAALPHSDFIDWTLDA
ncbi:hypothetical protein F5Y08DRAFT_337816 [Xylaria arbuscula]|nr:hypothetical protein F5Y08DRAFT_337816 [Xylaria arbuscula]